MHDGEVWPMGQLRPGGRHNGGASYKLVKDSQSGFDIGSAFAEGGNARDHCGDDRRSASDAGGAPTDPLLRRR